MFHDKAKRTQKGNLLEWESQRAIESQRGTGRDRGRVSKSHREPQGATKRASYSQREPE